MEQRVKISNRSNISVTRGSAGLPSQCCGEPLTVSAMAAATGGIGGSGLIRTSVK